MRRHGFQVTLRRNELPNDASIWVVYMPPKRIKNQAQWRLVVDMDVWAWQVHLLENTRLVIGLLQQTQFFDYPLPWKFRQLMRANESHNRVLGSRGPFV